MSRSVNEENDPKMVSDLMYDRRWVNVKLSLFFAGWERSAISSIPLPRFPDEDRWAWRFMKHGDFAVRSTYYVELETIRNHAASTSDNVGKDVWRKLWKSHVPRKIQLFGWRDLNGGIQVNETLGRRGMAIDGKCMMCGEFDKSITHALVLCTEAQNVWKLSPLRLDVCASDCASMMEWCISLVK